MQPVDIAIGVMGVLALVATGLGVALFEDGALDYVVADTTHEYDAQGPQEVDASGTDFPFATPNNTYGAMFTVDVAFSGQANPSAQVRVTVVLNGPDNSTSENLCTATFGDGSLTCEVESEEPWTETPEDFRGDESDVDARTKQWHQDIVVEVFVDGPCASPLPLPVCLDAYTATVSGHAMTYTIARDLPDVATA